jgi:hypothetical protein
MATKQNTEILTYTGFVPMFCTKIKYTTNTVSNAELKIHAGGKWVLTPGLNLLLSCLLQRMRWARHVTRMGGKERCIQDFGGQT